MIKIILQWLFYTMKLITIILQFYRRRISQKSKNII